MGWASFFDVTYTFKDVKELIGEDDENEYHWEVNDAKKPNR